MVSTEQSAGSIVTFSIKINGSPIPDIAQVISISIDKRVNRISSARVTILDGNASDGSFELSSSTLFVPGASVHIEGGYDNNNKLLFEGIITQQSIRIDDRIGSALEIECRDCAIKMTVGRKTRNFTAKKDSDIISTVISEYSLSAAVNATDHAWPQQVQHYVSDWDFVLSLAESNGMIITTDNNKLAVFSPVADTVPILEVSYGDGLLEFNASLNAVTQLGHVKASAWDHKTQTVAYTESSNSLPGVGNLSSKTLSEVIELESYELQTAGALDVDGLKEWSKAQLVKSSFSKIRGQAKFQGTPLAIPGKYITLKGLGDRFNGNHFVSGVVHSIADGNWTTEVSVGLSPAWFTEKPDVMAPPASGLIPGARGLFQGVVKQIYNDPDKEYRILVDVPMLNTGSAGIWARIANFYATGSAGALFLPEVGDEVVIGFFNEDPRYPVILGSMYSSSIKPAKMPDEKNQVKAIVSKSQISIAFDDLNKILTITTPDGNKIILSDSDKQICINDQNGNKVIMAKDGVTIKSAGNIAIEATQDINITATGSINLKPNV